VQLFTLAVQNHGAKKRPTVLVLVSGNLRRILPKRSRSRSCARLRWASRATSAYVVQSRRLATSVKILINLVVHQASRRGDTEFVKLLDRAGGRGRAQQTLQTIRIWRERRYPLTQAIYRFQPRFTILKRPTILDGLRYGRRMLRRWPNPTSLRRCSSQSRNVTI